MRQAPIASGDTSATQGVDWAAYEAGVAREVRLQPGPRYILAAAAAAGRVYTTDRNDLRVWDAARLQPMGKVGPGGDGITALAAGCGWLAGCGDDGDLRAWVVGGTSCERTYCVDPGAACFDDRGDCGELQWDSERLEGHNSTVRCLAVLCGGSSGSGSGEILFSGDDGGTIRVWRCGAGCSGWRCEIVLSGPAVGVDAISAALAPSGFLMVAAGSDDGKIWLWELPRLKDEDQGLQKRTSSRAPGGDSARNEDKKIGGLSGAGTGVRCDVVTENHSPADRFSCMLEAAESGAATRTPSPAILEGHEGGVTALAFACGASAVWAASFAGDSTFCAQVLASASEDGTVRLWRRDNRQDLTPACATALTAAEWICSRTLRAVRADALRAHAACVGFSGPALVAGCMVGGFSATERREVVIWDLSNRADGQGRAFSGNRAETAPLEGLACDGECFERDAVRLKQNPGQDVWSLVCLGGEVWAAIEQELVVWGRPKALAIDALISWQ